MSLTVSQVGDDSTHRVLFNCVGCWNCKIYSEFDIILMKSAPLYRLAHSRRDRENSHGREERPCSSLFVQLLQEQRHERAVVLFVGIVAHHKLVTAAGVVEHRETGVDGLVIACEGYRVLLCLDRSEPVVVAEYPKDGAGWDSLAFGLNGDI